MDDARTFDESTNGHNTNGDAAPETSRDADAPHERGPEYPDGARRDDATREAAARHGIRLGAPSASFARSSVPPGPREVEDEVDFDQSLADDFAASLREPEPFQDTALAEPFDADPIDLSPDAQDETENFYANGSGGNVPPDDTTLSAASASPAPESRDKELDLMDHLGELRTRLLWCVGFVGVAMAIAWNQGARVQEWFIRPIAKTLKDSNVGSGLVTQTPTEGFTNYFQIVLATALLATAPFLLYQMWAFIEPALTRQERRYATVLAPFSVALFFTGATLGYFMSPVFFKFFLAFQPKDSVALWSFGTCVELFAKMLLVFGICFQVPVVTLFVMKIGLVSRNVLMEYWRHVVVAIFIAVSIITPTWDPITLTACALPPCLLYGFSLWMVKWL